MARLICFVLWHDWHGSLWFDALDIQERVCSRCKRWEYRTAVAYFTGDKRWRKASAT